MNEVRITARSDERLDVEMRQQVEAEMYVVITVSLPNQNFRLMELQAQVMERAAKSLQVQADQFRSAVRLMEQRQAQQP